MLVINSRVQENAMKKALSEVLEAAFGNRK